MGALFAMIPARVYEYLAVALVVSGVWGWYTVHERHIGKAEEKAAVIAENKRVTDAAVERINSLTTAYNQDLKAQDVTYANNLRAIQSAHIADLDRLRQLAANHKGNPVLPSPAGPGAPPDTGDSGAIGVGNLFANAGVCSDLADALRSARIDLARAYAERDALTGK
jgi:hypothetical protein